MSILTLEDVEKIARLARLYLTEEEKRAILRQLSDVLDYVEQLSALDLTDVPPTAHAVAQQNILREDRVNAALPVEEALANAADERDDQFAIQGVFDHIDPGETS